VLMFARELDRRSKEAGWGILSDAAHPGLTKTNLQTSGPSHGRSKPSTMERFYKLSWRLTPFLWQEIDEGILPALYAATSPQAEGGAFYAPHGIYEAAGGGVAAAKVPARARNEADCRRLWDISEKLTGVSYPKPNWLPFALPAIPRQHSLDPSPQRVVVEERRRQAISLVRTERFMSAHDHRQKTSSETPELSEEGKEKVRQMQEAYDDDRPTVVMPGTGGTITGVAINEWLDDEGNPKFGKDKPQD
jgi:hypothetical protein